MKAQEIKNTVEAKAKEFGMSNTDVADNYANALPKIFSEKISEREEKEAQQDKEKIISLFKNELGIDADDDVIFDGAVLYAKEHATIKSRIN